MTPKLASSALSTKGLTYRELTERWQTTYFAAAARVFNWKQQDIVKTEKIDGKTHVVDNQPGGLAKMLAHYDDLILEPGEHTVSEYALYLQVNPGQAKRIMEDLVKGGMAVKRNIGGPGKGSLTVYKIPEKPKMVIYKQGNTYRVIVDHAYLGEIYHQNVDGWVFWPALGRVMTSLDLQEITKAMLSFDAYGTNSSYIQEANDGQNPN